MVMQVEASGMYHSAMEEQEERSNSNRMAEGRTDLILFQVFKTIHASP